MSYRKGENMNVKKVIKNSVEIAVVNSNAVCISDTQTALDFAMSINYEFGCNLIVLNKEAIIEDFFVLKTKIAGEILQKFSNYNIKIAIVGDFSSYESESLKDFMYESNKGRQVFFLSSEEDAVKKLSEI